jgi:HSP20 family protein
VTIVKWTPLEELDSVERRMRRLIEGVGFAPPLLPAADIYETDEEYVVEIEAPGFEKTELTVEVFDHTLAIKGEHVKAEEKTAKEFALHERLERDFERRFVLPVAADTEHLKATFDRGVLEVHAPKVPEAKPRKVAITKA